MRFTFFSSRAAAAMATARYVLPVPAGPIANTMSYSRTACRYSCWRTFRGDTTCRRAGPTERFSKKSTSEVDGSSFRIRIAASRSGFFGVYPRSMSFENSERSRAASAVLSGSPETETSRPRAAVLGDVERLSQNGLSREFIRGGVDCGVASTIAWPAEPQPSRGGCPTMYTITRRYALLSLASLFALAVSVPAAASSKKFTESDDAKQNDEPQEYLKDYDKLTKGNEADWVYFTEGVDLKSFKTVSLKTWGTTNKHSRSKHAAESGPEYLEQWIKRSKKLGWQVVKDGGDLRIEGNVFNAWEPSGGARVWGGWAANPGVGMELVAKDKSGKTIFEIRHKAKGSTLEDAVENGLEKIVKTLEVGK